jgi:uncharacterized protein YciI
MRSMRSIALFAGCLIAAAVALQPGLALAAAPAAAQAPAAQTTTTQPAAAPAPRVGPGGYEMTTYYVVFLYRGPSWSPGETLESQKIQEGHMANIQRLAKEGKLLLAGPFTDDGDLRGMFVFQVSSLEEAKALCDTDPAVKAGRLRVELHPWFSAKGINVPAPVAPPSPGSHP